MSNGNNGPEQKTQINVTVDSTKPRQMAVIFIQRSRSMNVFLAEKVEPVLNDPKVDPMYKNLMSLFREVLVNQSLLFMSQASILNATAPPDPAMMINFDQIRSRDA
jgi:hypothetical protein